MAKNSKHISLIAHIDVLPLFTTLAEAEVWGSQYGLSGTHTHNVLGQVGYMGGTNHQQIVHAMRRGVVNVLQPTQIRTVTAQSLPTNTGGSSSGGGYEKINYEYIRSNVFIRGW